MEILPRNLLLRTGFAGIREHRIITDSPIFGRFKPAYGQEGLGQFVCFADAQFLPPGETPLHDHQEMDIIALMAAGVCGMKASQTTAPSLAKALFWCSVLEAKGFLTAKSTPTPFPTA